MAQEKLLFITPHLSTGGAPQYLLKKIQELNNNFDIYCVEYNDVTGGVLVVQKDQIKQILGSKLLTLGQNKFELLEIINKINSAIIHFEEMPEYFCDHEIASAIYSPDRKYKIIETSHDSSFNYINKKFFPDQFVLVSNYQKKLLAPLGIPMEVVEYPIEYKNKTNRESSLISLGLDPNKTHFLNIGLFTPRKNQAEIIEYARELLNENIQFHFVGNQADNFKSYWAPLMENFPSNCKWWGERKDVDTFYNAMDVFIFTSKGGQNDKETMPLVLREAIGWKMPILMYNLDVYENYFDKFKNIVYLEKKSFNMETIKSFCSNFFDVSYDESLSKITFTVIKEHPNLKEFNFRMIDPLTGLVFNPVGKNLSFSINQGMWFIPNSGKNERNGICAEFFDSQNNIIQKNVFLDSSKDTFKPNRFPTTEIFIENNKVDIKCNPKDHSSFWSFYEIFIREDYKNIESGDVVVDVGANIGFFTLYAAKMGAKKIYSIEPIQETFDNLKHNTQILNNVSIFNFGLGSENKEVVFYVGDVSSISGDINYVEQTINDWGIEKKEEKVKIKNANDFLLENNIEYIDYLKIDCEGAELDFFNSINREYLSQKIKKITGEIHIGSIGLDGYFYIVNLLKSHGFEYNDNYTPGNTLVTFYCFKKPKIKILHLLNNLDGEREKASISSLKKLASFGLDYQQIITPKNLEVLDSANCNRPEMISDKPGHYLLTPSHYGCFLSHKKAICENFIENHDAILICECDCVVFGEYKEVYEKIINTYYLNNKYNLISTSFGKQIANIKHENIENDLYWTNVQSEAHCYLIAKQHIKEYSEKLMNSKWDTYDLWANIFLADKKRGIYEIPYALQEPGISSLDLIFKQGKIIDNNVPIFRINELDKDISVVIQSCDNYEKFWKGWHLSFSRYWNWNLNWPIYFCSEEKDLPFNDKRILNIKSPKSENASGFSNRLLDILNKIDTKYVLYMQEDMWPIVPVDFSLFKKCLHKIRTNDWNCLRIHEKLNFAYEFLKTSHFVNGKRLLKAKSNSEWLLTHNACIWNKNFLQSCLIENENPWQNEIFGTVRIAKKYKDPKIFHLNERWYYQPGASRNGNFDPSMEQYQNYLEATENLNKEFDII